MPLKLNMFSCNGSSSSGRGRKGCYIMTSILHDKGILNRPISLAVCAILLLFSSTTMVQAQQCGDGQYQYKNCTGSPSSSARPVITTTEVSSTTGLLNTTYLTPIDTTTISERTASVSPASVGSQCCGNCSTTCKTCMGGETNDCLSCGTTEVMKPDIEYCVELLSQCANTACYDACAAGTADICKCMINTTACQNCSLDTMHGSCYANKDACPPNTILESYQDGNVTYRYCFECADPLFGKFCTERYILFIVLIPVAAFVVVIILIVACMCCVYRGCCHGEEGNQEVPKKDYPKPKPPSRDHRGSDIPMHRHEAGDDFDNMREDFNNAGEDFNNAGEDFNNTETNQVDYTESDDVYGNVDNRNNQLMQYAPEAEHNASLRRDHAPYQIDNADGPQEIYENHELGPPLDDTQDEFYGNQARIPAAGMMRGNTYLPMAGNLHRDGPLEVEEPEEQEIYENQVPVSRNKSTPVRRPPEIPQKKKTARTFPAGIEPDFGQTNEGFQDDYPDLSKLNRRSEDEHCNDGPRLPPSPNKSPLRHPPAPPTKKKRPSWEAKHSDAGGGIQLSELQQKLQSKFQNVTPAPQSPNDLPSGPPPLPPQQTPDDIPLGPPPLPPPQTPNDLPSGPPPLPPSSQKKPGVGVGMTELQRQLESQLLKQSNSGVGTASRPGPPGPPPVSPKSVPPVSPRSVPPVPHKPSPPRSPYKQATEPEEDDIYEPVEYPDDVRGGPLPYGHRDPSDRPAMALPKYAVETQDVYEVQLPDKDVNPDQRSRMLLPGEGEIQEDELYEALDADNSTVPSNFGEVANKDVYQNTPVGKHNSGRYKNLAADPNQMSARKKDGGYAKWGGPSNPAKWTAGPR